MAARAGRGFVLRPSRPLFGRHPAVKALSAYAAEVMADSPIGYWRMSDTSGTVMRDSSGHVRNGTYVSSPTLNVSGLLSGDSDTAVQFGTGGDKAQVTYASWMDCGNNFTVETLIYGTASWSGNRDILGINHTLASNSRMILTSNGTEMLWRVYVGSTTYSAQSTGLGLATSTIYHVAGTCDGANIILYVNGTQVATTPVSGTINPGTTDFEIAQVVFSDFGGKLDEIAYYGTALSAPRIASHYAASQPPLAYRHKPQRAWRGIAAQQNGRW